MAAAGGAAAAPNPRRFFRPVAVAPSAWGAAVGWVTDAAEGSIVNQSIKLNQCRVTHGPQVNPPAQSPSECARTTRGMEMAVVWVATTNASRHPLPSVSPTCLPRVVKTTGLECKGGPQCTESCFCQGSLRCWATVPHTMHTRACDDTCGGAVRPASGSPTQGCPLLLAQHTRTLQCQMGTHTCRESMYVSHFRSVDRFTDLFRRFFYPGPSAHTRRLHRRLVCSVT